MALGAVSLLEQRFQGFSVLEDPSAVYEILDYYDELVEQDDTYIEEILRKLRYMVIDWPQPWYQRLSYPLGHKPAIDEDRLDDPEQYRNDRFTLEEDEIMHKNWRRFRKKFGLSDKPDSFARWRNKSYDNKKDGKYEQMRRMVTAYLAKGLERNPYQVYRHFVVEYAYPKKGPHTEFEEKVMDLVFEHKKDKEAVMILSKVLGREHRAIYNKYQIFLQGKEGMNKWPKIKWNLETVNKFIASIIKHCGGDLEALKDKHIPKVDWIKVEADMEWDYDYLNKMWYRKVHVQLFAQKTLTLAKVLKRIYKFLRQSEYRRWKDIRWVEVNRHMPTGCTPHFICRLSRRQVEYYCRNYLNRPLQEVLDIWKAHKPRRNKRLSLLRWDGDKFVLKTETDKLEWVNLRVQGQELKEKVSDEQKVEEDSGMETGDTIKQEL